MAQVRVQELFKYQLKESLNGAKINHVSNSGEHFKTFRPVHEREFIYSGEDPIPILGYGIICMRARGKHS
jgi:hypothetical protein